MAGRIFVYFIRSKISHDTKCQIRGQSGSQRQLLFRRLS